MSSHANAWKNGIKNNRQNLFVLWISLIVALLCIFTQGPETNPDIWFLLSVGRNILKNGFTTTDTLLMHENVHAIAQQWLSSIVFYKIYSVSGFFGLIALRNTFCILSSFLGVSLTASISICPVLDISIGSFMA